jgi:hypothetical protein
MNYATTLKAIAKANQLEAELLITQQVQSNEVFLCMPEHVFHGVIADG